MTPTAAARSAALADSPARALSTVRETRPQKSGAQSALNERSNRFPAVLCATPEVPTATVPPPVRRALADVGH